MGVAKCKSSSSGLTVYLNPVRVAGQEGEPTREVVEAGEVFFFVGVADLAFEDEGRRYLFNAFELADGRGWVHDVYDEEPNTPLIDILVPCHQELFKMQRFVLSSFLPLSNADKLLK